MTRITRIIATCAAATCALIAACNGNGSKSDADMAALDPDAPGLRVGDQVPPVTLVDENGSEILLSTLYADKPLVLVFYRGGWCPFCTRALKDWRDHVDEVTQLGANFVAVTPESPDNFAKTIDKNKLDYTVLGDPTLAAARAFHVHFTVDEATKEQYESYGIDVAANNSSGTWELPAPGTFIIDTDAIVRFADAHWDYKIRAAPEDVIAALKEIAE
jgi:peroxiredoxin